METFRDAYKEFSDKYVLSDDRLHLSNLERVMMAFTAQCVLSEQPFKVVVRQSEIATEKQLFGKLVGESNDRLYIERLEQYKELYDVQVSDISDGIVQNTDTGDLYSLEWKSTGEWLGDDTMAKYLMDDQVTTHTYVCRENGYDVKGVLMFIVQFSKLPMGGFTTNKKGEQKPIKCRIHGIPSADCWVNHLRFQRFFIERTEQQINQWKREAEREAYQYADAVERFRTTKSFAGINMKGLFNGTCRNCRLKPFCLSDRKNFSILETRQHTDPTIVRSGVYDS